MKLYLPAAVRCGLIESIGFGAHNINGILGIKKMNANHKNDFTFTFQFTSAMINSNPNKGKNKSVCDFKLKDKPKKNADLTVFLAIK
jgi:hypothetical protein